MKGTKSWEVEVDSEIGPLNATILYDIDYGEKGDYYTPPTHPSVTIIEVKFDSLESPDGTHDMENFEDEILEHELSPPDYED